MTSPPAPVPAYETKQKPLLTCHLNGRDWHLQQSDTSGETGSTLWLSAQVLCEYFISLHSYTRSHLINNSTPAQTVLELGAGIGLTALVLQSLGFDVTATDTKNICCDYLEPNVIRNGGKEGVQHISVQELDWFEPSNILDNHFDFVIATDVVYKQRLVPAFCTTIAKATAQRTTVYIAQEVRDPALFESFIDSLVGLGFKGSRISHVKLRKIMRDRGWQDEAWAGVVVWKFRRNAASRDD